MRIDQSRILRLREKMPTDHMHVRIVLPALRVHDVAQFVFLFLFLFAQNYLVDILGVGK